MIQTFNDGHAVKLADEVLACLYRLEDVGIRHLGVLFGR